MKVLNKKIIATCLIVAILATFIPTINVNADDTATPVVTMTASKTSVKAGEEFTVSLDLQNGLEGQKNISFTVNFDSDKITAKEDYVDDDGTNKWYMLSSTDGNQSLNSAMGNKYQYGKIDGNQIIFSYLSGSTSPTSGNLAKLTFVAKDDFNSAAKISLSNIRFSSVGDSGTDTDVAQTASVTINPIIDMTGITVTPSEINLAKGKTEKISASKVPANTTDTTAISYKSNDTAVATVSDDGTVTAVGKGTTTIDVTCGSYTQKVTVNVNVPLTALNISKSTLEMNINTSTTDITVQKDPTDTDDSTDIVWTSTDESVIKIDNATGTNPTIKAVGKGNATVTATCGSVSATCTITVNVPLDSISFNYKDTTTVVGDTITVEKDGTVSITATKVPADTSVTDAITWTIVDTSVATVADGVITGVKTGSTTLTVACGEKSYEFKVEVINPIKSISIKEGDLELYKGQTKDLTIEYTPADTTTTTAISWESSNSDVVKVENGKITAVAPGKATIKATLIANTAITSEITVTVPEVKATTVCINKDTTSIEQGETETLTAYLLPENTTDEAKFVWTTSDENIAKVENGVVTAVAPGSAEITATFGTLSAKCTVIVTRALDSIALNTTEMKLEKGAKSTDPLVVSYDPTNTTVDKTALKIESLNPEVATVDSDGYVTAVAPGTAYIKASLDGKEVSCKVTVIVTLTSVSIENSDKDLELVKNKTGELVVAYTPEDATEIPTAAWSSSDDTVATVDNNGKVTAKKAGTATITVDYDGITATRKVVVTEIPATGIVLDNTVESVLKGDKNAITLKPTAYPEDTTDDLAFTYKSSDEEIATVDKDGKVTGLKAGKVTITIALNDAFEKIVDLEVKEVPLTGIEPAKGNDKFSVTEGDKLVIAINPTPENTTDDLTYTYISSDESILTVDKDGVVTTKKAGTAYVTVTSTVNPKATCQVQVDVAEKKVETTVVGGTSSSTESSAAQTVAEVASSTVTSPHTGDMNIELLGIMLVVSILGMAIVIKKK